MRIEHLYYLQEIVKAQSFSGAASQLHVSQQSLSEAVARIEKQFDFKIFNRSRNGAKLSEKGAEFMKDIDKLLFQYNHILSKYGNEVFEEKNTLKVCVNPLVSAIFPDKTISQFRLAYPDVALTVLEQADPRNVFSQLISMQADVGITSVSPAVLAYDHDWRRELQWDDLFMDYLCIFIRHDHPLAKNVSVNFQDISNEPLVVDNNGAIKNDVLAYYSRTQLEPVDFNFVMETNSSEAYVNAVVEGIAIGFITKFLFLQLNHPELVAIPIKDVAPLHFIIACAPSSQEDSIVNKFIEIFKETLAR